MNQDITFTQNPYKALPKVMTVKVKYWWLIVISLLLRVLPYIFTETSSSVDLKRICLLLSYAILLFALVRNFHIKGVWVIAIGTLLNFIAILANGSFMPVSPEARFLAAKTPIIMPVNGLSLTRAGGVILLPEQTKLRILTDIFPVSSIHTVFSIGDIVIGIGILVVCIEIILQAVKRTAASVPKQ